MKQEVEIEYKNLLTQDEYNKLKKALFNKDAEPVMQENYYFDTADYSLKDHKCALRIRVIDKLAEMTLKTPFEGHHTETTLELDPSKAEELLKRGAFELPSDILSVLKEENIVINSTVSLIADLRTERLEAVGPHTTVVLDKSFYSSHTDYELEVESDSKETGERAFSNILKKYDIHVRPTASKIARAFNALT